jgi:hypothetical protein
MAGLPLSLVIALWLVGAVWLVALATYFLDASSDIVWLVLFLGTGTALFEWRARK